MKTPILSALRLTTFAAVVLFAVSLVHLLARKQIATQQTAALLQQFKQIAPHLVLDEHFLAQKIPVIVAGHKGFLYPTEDGSTFIQTSTDKGYNGEIGLLVGIAKDHKTLLGVRVLHHKETPGLGDKIEVRLSPWITQFAGKSLANSRFAVKKDGGDFDAFTGATITPRAVVNEIGAVLQNVPMIFKAIPQSKKPLSTMNKGL